MSRPISYHFIYIFLILTSVSCNNSSNYTEPSDEIIKYSLEITSIENNLDSSHFRGLASVDQKFVVSGTQGYVLEIIGHEIITQKQLHQARHTDLRDVHLLNNGQILLMGIGSPGNIWMLKHEKIDTVYNNPHPEVFLDGIDFWNDSSGLAFGDPINRKQFILKTTDGGQTWQRIDTLSLPQVLPTEAGFAASGTSLVCLQNGIAMIGMGGTFARIIRTSDFGTSWTAVPTPMQHGKPGTGIYSIAFSDSKFGVAVGGNWEQPMGDSSKIYTSDGGLTWNLAKGIQHYRSCVIHFKDQIFISTGTNGTDISYDGGKNWELLHNRGFNALLFQEDGSGLGVGNYGNICHLNLIKLPSTK